MSNLRSLNGFPFDYKEFSVSPMAVTAGDASADGCYLALVSEKQETLVSKAFSAEQSLYSIAWRESFVIHNFFTSPSIARFRGSRVCHYTDSQAVTRIFTIGSPVSELQIMAEQVCTLCRQFGVSLEFVWQRRNSELMTDG